MYSARGERPEAPKNSETHKPTKESIKMSITFSPVNREDIPASSTRSTSESAQLFDAFLNSDAELVQVNIEFDDDADAEAKASKVASVRSTLGNYIDRHNKPVKLFTRNGNLYMERISDEEAAERKAKLEARRAEKASAESNGEATASDATSADLA